MLSQTFWSSASSFDGVLPRVIGLLPVALDLLLLLHAVDDAHDCASTVNGILVCDRQQRPLLDRALRYHDDEDSCLGACVHVDAYTFVKDSILEPKRHGQVVSVQCKDERCSVH